MILCLYGFVFFVYLGVYVWLFVFWRACVRVPVSLRVCGFGCVLMFCLPGIGCLCGLCGSVSAGLCACVFACLFVCLQVCGLMCLLFVRIVVFLLSLYSGVSTYILAYFCECKCI